MIARHAFRNSPTDVTETERERDREASRIMHVNNGPRRDGSSSTLLDSG